jgi:hypothetical protein
MPAMPVSPGEGAVEVGTGGVGVLIAGAAVDVLLPDECGVAVAGATVATRAVALAVAVGSDAEPHADTSVAATNATTAAVEGRGLRVTPPA